MTIKMMLQQLPVDVVGVDAWMVCKRLDSRYSTRLNPFWIFMTARLHSEIAESPTDGGHGVGGGFEL